MFEGTVREAVDPLGQHTDAQVEGALSVCGLRHLSTRHVDLDTMVATGGSDWSSGECALLVLARAFLRRPVVLVLDEAAARGGAHARAALQVTLKINVYGYRTDNKKPPVTYRFLNLSVILDLSPGAFLLSISSRW